jgi:hypothetical protein
MYTTELAADVPVKNELATNVRVWAVPGKIGIALPDDVTVTELAVAKAAVAPTPKNTTVLPVLVIK